MATPKRNRVLITPSVSLEVAAYQKYLVRIGVNASREANDAIEATAGFKEYMKNVHGKEVKK